MSYYGSWKINDTLVFVVNTHNPTNGMAQNADAVPSYHVYEDETATPILTGTMALLNNPNTIGFYSEQLTLSAANGLEKGKSYNIYVRAVVANVTGTMSHNFQIEAEVDANTVSVPVTAGMVTGSVLGNVNGSVASVTAGVTVTTNNDKSGYSLSSPQNFNLVGNITGTFVGNVNGAVQSVTNPVTVGTNNDKSGYGLATPQSVNIIGNISGTITNVLNVVNPVTAGMVTGSVLGNVNGSVNSVTQPVGILTGTFLEAAADKVWDETLSGHLGAGSTGNALNAAGSAGDPWSTSLPGAYTAGQAGHILASRMPTGTVLVGDKTGFSLSSPQSFNLIGNITGTITNVLNVVNPVVAGVVTGSVLGNVNGSVGSVTSPVGLNTGTIISAIADGIWDEALAGHLSAGSTGNALNGAGSAGDPWGTSLPGSYTPGQAGHILASRMPTGTVIVGSNLDKSGYGLSSPQNINIVGNLSGTIVGNIQGNVTGSVGSLTDIASALGNKIADYVLRRSFANARASSDGDAVSFRSLLGAVAKLVNRWKINGTTLTVYQEDDSTALGTQTLTGTAGADPITESDTN